MTGGGDDLSSPYSATYTWTSSTAASGSQTVTATNGAGSTSTGTFTVTNDTAAPTGQSIDLSGGPWYTTTSVPLTLDWGSDAGAGLDTATETVQRASAPLSGGTCGTFGSWTAVTLSSGADTTVTSGHCYRYRLVVSDKVGNQATSSASADAEVDTSPPSAARESIAGQSPVGFWRLGESSGTVAYDDTGADNGTYSGSGVTLGTAGATNDGDTAATFDGTGSVDLGNPVSLQFAGDMTVEMWLKPSQFGSRMNPWAKAFNGEGSIVVEADGTLTYYYGTGGGDFGSPTYYYLATPLPLNQWTHIAVVRDLTNSTVKWYVNGQLAQSYAAAYSFAEHSNVDMTIGGGYNGGFKGAIDDVAVYGSALSGAQIAADYGAGVHGGLTLSESSANESISSDGTMLYYAPTGSNTGSFTVTASPADTESGVASVAFPTVFGSDSSTQSTGPYATTYSWTASDSASGSKTVTATNGAGGTTASTFTVTADTTAPSGQSVALSGGPWYTTASIPLTIANGTDSGSGLDTSSGDVDRQTATLSNGTCGTFGSWQHITLTGGADTSVTSGHCYHYRYSISDKVGNVSDFSATSADAKLDTSAPPIAVDAPTAAGGSGAQHYVAGSKTLWFNPATSGSFTLNATATDSQSGIAHVSFPDVSGTSGWSGSSGGDDGSSPYASPVDYSWTVGATALGSTTITASNGAGLSANDSLTVSADSTAPTGQSVSLVGGPSYSTASVPLSLNDGTDAQSGTDHASGLVERQEATLSGGTCGSFGSWSSITLTGGADTTVQSGHCYRYRYTISDYVGNASSASATTASAEVDTNAPDVVIQAPTATAGAANQYYDSGTTTLYFRPGGSGSFTLNATASAGGSGIAHVDFPDLSSFDGFSGTGGSDTTSPYSSTTYSWTAGAAGDPESQDVSATSNTSNTASASITITPDSTAPTGQSADLSGGPWYTTTSVPLTIDNGSDAGSGIDASSVFVERAEAALTDGTCGSFASWSSVTLDGGADTTVQSGHCYRYRVTVSDRVGNASTPSAASADAKVSTSTPTVAVTAPTALTGTGNQYWDGATATLWFRPAGAGSFQLNATASDGGGIDHVAFPDLSALNGFSGAGGSDTTSPYSSATYAWTAGATGDPGTRQVVATANSSLTASDPVTISPDSTAPSGQSVALSGGPWYTSASVPLTLDLGSDADSGIDSSSVVVERAEATLTGGSCDTFGAWSTVTLDSGADTTVQSGHCYRYRLSVSDHVGNQSSASAASADAKVDTTAPSAPSLTVSESSPLSYVTGTTLYYNPQSSNSGSFSVTATSTDAQSGVAKITFPSVSGATGGGDDLSSPYSAAYDWDASTGASGAQTVTVHNGAGATATAAFMLTPDTAAPTGQTVDLSGGPWYSNASVPLTIDTGSDAGSGVDAGSLVVERDTTTLTGSTCDTFTDTWSTVTLQGGADTTVTSGHCYRYRIHVSDNVGNASADSAVSATAKVDTTAPTVAVTAPTAVTGAGAQYWASGSKTLWFRPSGSGSFTLGATASDAGSGVDHVSFPDLSGVLGWSGTGGSDATSPYASGTYSWSSGAVAPGAKNVTAVNGGGGTASDTITISADSTAPTGQSATVAGGWYGTASVAVTIADGSDGGSGIDSASGVVERSSAPLTAGACGSFGAWAPVTLDGSGDDTTVTSGNCYRYRYTISDRVGNQSAPSAASVNAKVDTTAPAAPTLTLSESSSYSSASGTTLYYNPQGSNSGSFSVTATSTDADSGIAGVTFPDVFGSDGATDAAAPFSNTYSWSASDSASGAKTVTVTNGAGGTATGSFTVTPDTTAPSGQTVSLSGGPWYSGSVTLTLANGTDAGAGVDTSSGVVERDSATLANGTCGPFSGTWTAVTLSGNADSTVTGGHCYRYRYTISDKVGNVSSPSAASGDAKIDSTAPTVTATAPTELTGAGAQYWKSGTKTLYFRPSGSGSFTLNATASDAESGIANVTFPSVSAIPGWSGSTGGSDATSPYSSPVDYAWTAGASGPSTVSIGATNGAGLPASDLISIVADSNGPTGQSVTLAGGSWYTSASVPLTLANGSDAQSGVDATSGHVERDATTLTNGTCGTFNGDWAPVTLVGNADTTVQSGHCYRYRYTISDNVGNASSPSSASGTAKVDTTAPAVSASGTTELSGAGAQVFDSGSNTIWFRPGASGSFTVSATASDGDSGVDHVTFPDLTGVSGWAGSGGTAATDPYASTTYSWSAGATAPGDRTITATNGAGGTGTATVTIAADTTAPTGQSVDLGAGTWYTTASVPLTLTTGSDTQSGIDGSSGLIERDATTLSGGVCGTFNGDWSPVLLSSGADTTVQSGHCYRYRYTISDKVGNQSSASAASADAKVDTTAPSTPTLTLSESSASEYASGTTLYYNPQGSNSGSFTVTATATDGGSGIASVTFPDVFGSDGTTDSTPSFSNTYSWSASDSASGAQTVTVTNGAGGTATGSFTVTPDTTAPSGQSVDLGAGTWYTTASIPLTITNGTDTGAGIDTGSGVVERSEATLANGTCDPFGPWTAITPTGNADTTVQSGHCYRYRYTISDKVGNTTSASTPSGTAKVDTSDPTVAIDTPDALTGAAAQYFDSATGTLWFNPASTGTFTLNATASDSESGVDHVTFPDLSAVSGFSGTGGDDATGSYSSPDSYSWSAGAAAPGPRTIVATNAAGRTASATITISADSTAPSGQTIDTTGGPWYTTASVPFTFGDGTDTGSGLDTSSRMIERASAPLSNGTCGQFSAYTGSYTSPDTSVQSGYCYRYRLTVSDRVGNASTPVESAIAKIDTVDPAAPALTISESDAGSSASGTTLYYNPQGSNSGSFTVTATTSDADSGVAGVTFPAVFGADGGGDQSSPYTHDYTWSATDTASGSKTVTVTDAAGRTSNSTFTVTPDTTAPTGQTIALAGGPWYTTASVGFTLGDGSDGQSGIDASSRTVERASATLNTDGTCGSFGAFGGSYTSPDASVVDGHCYEYRFTIADAVGNVSTAVTSAAAKVDTTAPTVTLTAPGSYVNGNAADPFTVAATTPSADVAQVEFFRCSNASASCSTGSWVSLGTDTVAPFSASWPLDSEGNRALRAVVTDHAGNTGSDVVDTLIDRTAPSGGSVDYPDGYSGASVTVTTGDGTDAGSGVDGASGVIERDETPLSGNTCNAFPGSWSTITSPDETVQSGLCYRYRYRVADLAGNVATYTSTNVVKVDATPPSAPGITLSASSPFEAVSGTTLYYNPSTGNSGSFDVAASSSDAQSGITSVTFPVIFGGDGGTDADSPYSTTYSWDDTATAVGQQTVTATNGANLTADGTFTLTPDVTGPTGGSISYADGYTATASVALTLANGTDAGAGLAVSGMELQRASATLANATCDTFGGFTTIATDPALTTSDLTVTSGHCYQYRYLVSDLVGNQTTYTSPNIVKVDADAPTAVLDDPGQYLSGTVTLTSSSTDTGGSGLASVAFQRSPHSADTWTTISTDAASPWSASLDTTGLAEGAYDFRVVAVDGAGNTTTSPTIANVHVDNSNPTVTLADPGRNVHGTITLSAAASDAGSGIASITYQTSPAGQSTWTTTTATWDTTALTDGLYDVHAIARDNTGNTSTSTVANVRVDNTPPTATLDDPGQYVHGIVTLSSTTADCGLRHRPRRVPVVARGRRDLVEHRQRLGHHRTGRRELRRARLGDRQGRERHHLHGAHGDGRQHRADGDDGRPGCVSDRDGEPDRDLVRLGLGRRHDDVPVLAAQRRHVDVRPGLLGHHRRSPTAPTTCARSSPTTRATRPPRRSSPTGRSTTPPRSST